MEIADPVDLLFSLFFENVWTYSIWTLINVQTVEIRQLYNYGVRPTPHQTVVTAARWSVGSWPPHRPAAHWGWPPAAANLTPLLYPLFLQLELITKIESCLTRVQRTARLSKHCPHYAYYINTLAEQNSLTRERLKSKEWEETGFCLKAKSLFSSFDALLLFPSSILSSSFSFRRTATTWKTQIMVLLQCVSNDVFTLWIF